VAGAGAQAAAEEAECLTGRQRHLQRWREPDRNDERPVSAAAQCYPRAGSSGRARLPAITTATWHRQSDARGQAQYTAEQVYSTARQEIQDKIRGLVESRLGEKMMEHEGEEESYRISLNDTVLLYDTLVQGIELPQLVVGAINRKTEQYYISEEYKFRVEREKRESERKKIEAEGVPTSSRS
jgi:hypothetical protein